MNKLLSKYLVTLEICNKSMAPYLFSINLSGFKITSFWCELFVASFSPETRNLFTKTMNLTNIQDKQIQYYFLCKKFNPNIQSQ